jgi:hypothetical protein
MLTVVTNQINGANLVTCLKKISGHNSKLTKPKVTYASIFLKVEKVTEQYFAFAS